MEILNSAIVKLKIKEVLGEENDASEFDYQNELLQTIYFPKRLRTLAI